MRFHELVSPFYGTTITNTLPDYHHQNKGGNTGTGGNTGNGGSSTGGTTGTDNNTNTGGRSTVQAASITAKDIIKVYSAKAQSFSLNAKTNSDAKLAYKSSDKKVEIDKSGKLKLPKNYVGKFTVTVKAAATSKFTAVSKKVTVTITPPKVTLKSVSSPKKGWMKIIWKPAKGISGYQLEISEAKNFSSGKQKKYNLPGKKNSVTASGLKSGKPYYVRIRTTMKVKKKTCLGPWSATKSVKIK